ncbi:MarR family transcriptional regulator [Leptospira kemamanensis]|uniref:MarR family transcriptional regulator n=1 Tax=Leptospira kemamanensis TaxID=2484942 RepID=A0A4R9JVT8_9LEPT|nr:MarR family transcriptional regulator [Leptospira kemamanensis]TGL56069.1 MarR family transcriptional regulator [Leptospira kemamanensis]
MSKVKSQKDEVLLLKNQICFSMYSSMHRLMKLYRPLLADIGLTYPQYIVMLVMWEEKISTVSKIGERLQLDSGTLTPLLKRLEQMDYLIRERSNVDERIVNIVLTKKGKSLREKAKLIPEKIFCLSGIEETQASQLKQILDQLGSH